MSKCFVCRRETSFFNRWINSALDNTTGQNVCVCNSCARNLKKYGISRFPDGSVSYELVHLLSAKGGMSPEQFREVQADYARDIAYFRYGDNNLTGSIFVDNNIILLMASKGLLVVNQSKVNFSDIVNYSVSDNVSQHLYQAPTSTTYNTSSEHGLRRAVIGNIFAGGVGAVIGAATANNQLSVNNSESSSFQSVVHDYVLYINLKSLYNGGVISIRFGNNEMALNIMTRWLDSISNKNKY